LRTVGARGGKTGLVGRFESQRIDKSVAIVVGRIDDFAIRVILPSGSVSRTVPSARSRFVF
jgi:hypothetical protein